MGYHATAATEHRSMDNIDISIVTTLFRSAEFVEEFKRRAATAAAAIGSYEIIFVNDGSPDDSVDRAIALHEVDPHVVVVDLSRNFGHHRAIMAGLAAARGKYVFSVDVDLEEAPEYLTPMLEALKAGNADRVYGYQEVRRAGRLQEWLGSLFSILMARLTDSPYPRNAVSSCMMTRRFVKELLKQRQQEFLMTVIFHLTGFKQIAFPVVKSKRPTPSSYSLSRRFDLAVRVLTTNSVRLLYNMFYAGLAISLLSFCGIAYLLIHSLVSAKPPSGWPSLIISVWFFGGLLLFGIGVLGLYLADIHSEVRRRPRVIIRKLYRAAPQTDAVQSSSKTAIPMPPAE